MSEKKNKISLLIFKIKMTKFPQLFSTKLGPKNDILYLKIFLEIFFNFQSISNEFVKKKIIFHFRKAKIKKRM